MDTPPPQWEQDPTALPPGTQVGAWRVDRLVGRGSYGTVYRAAHAAPGHAGPVALKLAISPMDARFEREVELLSRIRHPSVPRLLDSGQWKSRQGDVHPFVVMEWVEGIPLYVWAAWNNPSSRQVLALLAQAARALQATHEVSAMHRDVKGDNMLVRPSDGRLFLTDFGEGYFSGATRLTPPRTVPGTPDYRSPVLWEYEQHAGPGATFSPLARPWDDVFALGVTAYRLVTGTYPPFTHPAGEHGQCWLPEGRGAPPPGQLNPRVDAQLNALILRMLSPRPEERGSGLELAEALERGAVHAPASADAPLYGARAWPPAQARPGKVRRWLPWLAAVMALGLWPAGTGSMMAPPASDKAQRKEDSVSLGDKALNPSENVAKALSKDGIALELPKNPLPGQVTPNSKGRCPKERVAINGSCWVKVPLDADECPGNLFVYDGGCYVPIFEKVRQPTSAPQPR